ncbi:restriction endonuclease subunit S (plasmid) [Moraxella atlantae]|uniref:restriction endonuclease subunit S n=1 Tax=Faucicola atlantae TaxID=34059 RepID=UPI003753DD62
MQFNAYSNYKNSGVEWLGEVPSHWQDYSYQHLFKKKEIINQTQEQLLSVYLDRGVIPYSEGGGLVHKPADSLEKYQLVDIDDFVMNNQQAWRGSVGISAYRGIVSPAYLIFSINKDLANSKFLKYLLKDKSIVEQFMLASMSVGTIQRQIKWHLLKNLHINLPPIDEQNQIADFLDNETAKIDNLIAKQEQLIVLLEEQRKSVISYAVTKGLDPNVPMKDSGVEWLGEVPEHWKVLQNRHSFNFSKGLNITKENLQDTGIPCVSYGEVHSKLDLDFDPNLDDMKFVSENYLETNNNCLLNYGDFIFADTSEDFEGSGNFSYLNSTTPVFAGYHTVIARLKTAQNPRFFAYVFESDAHRKQIQTQVKGIKVFSITQGMLKGIYSWIPPIDEQNKIVEYLDNECQKIEQLKVKQKELINQLKEYRTSVISHAVTGKIDIRGLL